jgi:hypothetical protein
MVDLGGAQQRLGGNATPIETNTAEIITFDDRGLEPELRRTDCGDVAAGSRADDDDVERIWHLHLHDSQTRFQAKRERSADSYLLDNQLELFHHRPDLGDLLAQHVAHFGLA